MKPLRFCLRANGREQKFTIPSDYVESEVIPSAEHEAGHVIAAYHLNARVLGIAVGFVSDQNQQGMFLQARYTWDYSTVETRCVVKAAGRAADILFRGRLDEQGDRRDLQDIEALTGQASFEPFLGAAKNILSGYGSEISCIARALCDSLEMEEEFNLDVLPGNDIYALLLNEAQLMRCLVSKSRSPDSD